LKTKIAFYKAKNGNWDDKFIDFVTGKKGYSHCEIVINSMTMIGSHYTMNGVREAKYNNVYESGLWDVYEINIPYKDTIKKARSMLGLEYDLLGAIISPFFEYDPHPSKVFCSEFCAECLGLKNTIITPNDLFEYVLYDMEAQFSTSVGSKNLNKPIMDRYGRTSIKSIGEK